MWYRHRMRHIFHAWISTRHNTTWANRSDQLARSVIKGRSLRQASSSPQLSLALWSLDFTPPGHSAIESARVPRAIFLQGLYLHATNSHHSITTRLSPSCIWKVACVVSARYLKGLSLVLKDPFIAIRLLTLMRFYTLCSITPSLERS